MCLLTKKPSLDFGSYLYPDSVYGLWMLTTFALPALTIHLLFDVTSHHSRLVSRESMGCLSLATGNVVMSDCMTLTFFRC